MKIRAFVAEIFAKQWWHLFNPSISYVFCIFWNLIIKVPAQFENIWHSLKFFESTLYSCQNMKLKLFSNLYESPCYITEYVLGTFLQSFHPHRETFIQRFHRYICHTGFLALLSCAKLRFISLAEQCHNHFSIKLPRHYHYPWMESSQILDST